MVKRIQRMTLISGNRGFTLIEVLIAISIVVISLGVLFDIIYKANRDLDFVKKTFEDTIVLDSKIKLNDTKDVEISEKSLSIYPQILEKEYKYREVYFFKYELKRK